MSTRIEDFENFVNSQQETPLAPAESQQIKDEWLKNLESLYGSIVEYLKSYIDTGSVTYSFAEVKLNEEAIGEYSARRMKIKIGRQRVSLEPVGTMLIGCKGRVDVEGTAGRVHLLLVSSAAKSTADLYKINVVAGILSAERQSGASQITWAWKILDAGRNRFDDVDRESFFEILMEVAGR